MLKIYTQRPKYAVTSLSSWFGSVRPGSCMTVEKHQYRAKSVKAVQFTDSPLGAFSTRPSTKQGKAIGERASFASIPGGEKSKGHAQG